MDKVRERGAPLPGNDKENWGNGYTGIWKGRKKKEKRKKRKGGEEKWGEKEKEEIENEELTEEEEEHGDHGVDKLKSSRANEWGKLGWY